MPKQVDADTKVATIRKSVEQSATRVRSVRCHAHRRTVPRLHPTH